MKSLIVCKSVHHGNTKKVAKAMASILKAKVVEPEKVNDKMIKTYDLIGFGSGIYDGMHHKKLLDLAERLPDTDGKKAFLFSTSAIVNEDKVTKDHTALRNVLRRKGYMIVDEFACKGFNTNSFLKYFGGMNKGRPNQEDLELAGKFALNLRRKDLTID